MTALTMYLGSTADTLLTTARKLSATAPPSETSTAATGSLAQNGTGRIELWSFNANANTTLAGSFPAASGHGFIWDDPTLEGQYLVAGNWTPTLKLSCPAGTFVVDIHLRVFKRSAAGVYTQLASGGVATDLILAGQTITSTATVFTFPAVALDALSFVVGDKLYVDVVVNITTGNSNATASNRQIRIFENGGANESVVTPGYLAPTLITDSDTGSGSDAASITAAVSDGETGSGVEAMAVVVGGADVGLAVDAAAAVAVGSSDVAAGVELSTLSPGSSESGATADAVAGVSLIDSEAVGGAEVSLVGLGDRETVAAVESGAVGPLDTDAGSGTEAISLTLEGGEVAAAADSNEGMAVASSDASAGVDAGLPGATIISSDAAAGSENGSLGVTAVEASAGSDAEAISAQLADSDASHAQDSASVGLTGSEDALAIEDEGLRLAGVETATGGEAVMITFAGSDASQVSEQTVVMPQSHDTAGGLEVSWQLALGDSDTGSAVDAGVASLASSLTTATGIVFSSGMAGRAVGVGSY